MEDLIRDAGVSRTSSYRRWPTKDRFAADLLLAIAERTQLTDDLSGYVAAARTLPVDLFSGLDTEQGRRDLVVELMRVVTVADFTMALASAPWRSYLVLRAAHGGLPDGELRTRIADALRATERGFQARRADVLRHGAGLMGYRLRDPGTIDWATLAVLTSASFTGLLVQALSDPDAVLAEQPRAAFGSSRTAPWSAATLASTNLFFGATEPDPDVSWDAPRIAATIAALQHIDETLADVWTPSASV